MVGTGELFVTAVGSSTRTLEVSGGSYNSTTFSTGAASSTRSSTRGLVSGPTGDNGAGAGEVAPFEESSASRWGIGRGWWGLGLLGVLWVLVWCPKPITQ